MCGCFPRFPNFPKSTGRADLLLCGSLCDLLMVCLGLDDLPQPVAVLIMIFCGVKGLLHPGNERFAHNQLLL